LFAAWPSPGPTYAMSPRSVVLLQAAAVSRATVVSVDRRQERLGCIQILELGGKVVQPDCTAHRVRTDTVRRHACVWTAGARSHRPPEAPLRSVCDARARTCQPALSVAGGLFVSPALHLTAHRRLSVALLHPECWQGHKVT